MRHPYRHQGDMHLQALYMHIGRHMGKSKFHDYKLTSFASLRNNQTTVASVFEKLEKDKPYVVCLNDDFPSDPPNWAFTMFDDLFERLFPDKAKYEL